MATHATGLLASFGPAGLTPARFRLEVSPFHLRFLPFHAFPSAITRPAVSRGFFIFFASLNLFLFSIEHTRALAQVRPFTREIFFRRRSLFPCPPYALSPVFLHHCGVVHQTSLRS